MKTTLQTLCTALLALSFFGCKPPEGQGVRRPGNDSDSSMPTEQKQFLTPVVAIAVERGEITATVAATATIVPTRSRLLTTEEGGRLYFDQRWSEGDFVAKGTRIAYLESDTLRGEIERTKADLEIRRQSLDISKKSMNAAVRDFEVYQDLYSRGISALSEVESRELTKEQRINSYRQEEINLLKAQSQLKETEDRLERLEIFAPFDGLLVSSNTLEGSKPFSATFGKQTITDTEGRLISSGFNVCGIIDISQVLLKADITSKDIGRIEVGQEVMATIYGTTEKLITGEVVEIARSVNEETRAFQVSVLADNPDKTLRPGMFARLEIITERRQEAISINKDYIVRRNDRQVIFVVGKSEDSELDIAREVPVELGLEGREEIEVTFGLQDGDLIITRGFEVLQDKTPITVIRGDQPEVIGEPEKAEEKEETPTVVENQEVTTPQV